MMQDKQLWAKLRKEYPGDYCVYYELFGSTRAYVYTYLKDAKKHYARIMNSVIGDTLNGTVVVIEVLL